jgi:hypothetical protein
MPTNLLGFHSGLRSEGSPTAAGHRDAQEDPLLADARELQTHVPRIDPFKVHHSPYSTVRHSYRRESGIRHPSTLRPPSIHPEIPGLVWTPGSSIRGRKPRGAEMRVPT